MNRRNLMVSLAALAALVAACTGGGPEFLPNAEGYLLYVDPGGAMLDGHDAVAFFSEDRPVAGSPSHQATYQGALYHFSSAGNLQAFEQEPAKYAPRFGGFCAMSVSLGKLEPSDVTTFSIVDDRLVVQRNTKAKNMWSKDVAGNLARAEKNWPGLLGDARGPRG